MGKHLNIYILALLSLPLLGLYAQSGGGPRVIMVNKGKMFIGKNTEKVATFFNFENEGSGTLINNGGLYIKADYKNEGVVDHDNGGTTFFQSLPGQTNKKKIEAGTSTSLYNVVFDSSVSDPTDNAAFDLTGDVNIKGEAAFDLGIVNNRNSGGRITFWDNATVVGASDDSYVNGMVEKVGSTSFEEFPIGSYKTKQYRFAGISAPSDANHLVEAEYFLEDSNTIHPHNQKDESVLLIDNQEYWKLTGTNNLKLTLTWDEDTTPQELLANSKAIRIVRWDGTQWKNAGGIIDEGTRRVTSFVQGEGIFTLALVDDFSEDEIVVFNAISPNSDDRNDAFLVEAKNGEQFDELAVKIYNRWGVLVFESSQYQSDRNNTFYGYSNGRVVVDRGTLLPRGTYWYIIEYAYVDVYGKNRTGTKVGYLYIANDPNVNDTL